MKDFFEITYYIFASTMLPVAIWQFMEFRKEAKNRFTRESKLTVLDRLQPKFFDLYNLEDKFWDAIDKEKMPKLPEIDNKNLLLSPHKHALPDSEWLKWMKSSDSYETRCATSEINNILEDIAHYVYSGVLDEEFCFNLNGELFIEHADKYLPYMVFERDKHDSDTFMWAICLYAEWKEKVNEKNESGQQISKKLKGIPSSPNRKPIGM